MASQQNKTESRSTASQLHAQMLGSHALRGLSHRTVRPQPDETRRWRKPFFAQLLKGLSIPISGPEHKTPWWRETLERWGAQDSRWRRQAPSQELFHKWVLEEGPGSHRKWSNDPRSTERHLGDDEDGNQEPEETKEYPAAGYKIGTKRRPVMRVG